MPLNPYIAGNPIGGDDGFYGRDDILRDVTQVLAHRQQNAIVLYGQRRIGKTSVLLQLERRLAADGRYTPVYFDLMDRAGKPLTAVLWELTQRICLTLHLPVPERALFDGEGIYFRDTFLPQAAGQAAAGGLVLLFDEFDVLDSPTQEQAGATFFPYLRSWMSQATKVQFVFVIGRRPEDLSTNTMSAFKNIKATRVGLLAQRDAEKVIRLAEENGTLQWPDEAVTAVWNWSQGHPYVTQLLCETIWNQAYEEDEGADKPPLVTPPLVETALNPALDAGANAFVWLWDGLPPAERVVMAAIAEADKELITGDDLVEILNRSGVRLIVSQLNVAPETLVEWGLLQQEDSGYKVTVPLLRLWVKRNRPLSRVKDELDRLDPLADRLYRTGEDYYALRNLAEAQSMLQRALEINPNHLKARLLLGQIYFEEGNLSAAVVVLEEAYQYDERAARADLVRALLAQAENENKEAEQLALYERILQIDRQQPVALERQQSILAARRKREIARQLGRAEKLEAEERWPEVVTIYQTMLAEVEDPAWQTRLAHAEKEAAWQQKYTQALGALETSDKETAKRLLAEIISQKPDYKEAARYLLLTTKSFDADMLQARMYDQAEEIAKLADAKLRLEDQNAVLRAQVEKSRSWQQILLVGGASLLLGLGIGAFAFSIWSQRDQMETATATPPPALVTTSVPIPTSVPELAVSEAGADMLLQPGPEGVTWQIGDGESLPAKESETIQFAMNDMLTLVNGRTVAADRPNITNLILPAQVQLFLDGDAEVRLRAVQGVQDSEETQITLENGLLLVQMPEGEAARVVVANPFDDEAWLEEPGLMVVQYQDDPFIFMVACLEVEDYCRLAYQDEPYDLASGQSICFGGGCPVVGAVQTIDAGMYAYLAPGLIAVATAVPTETASPTATNTRRPTTPRPGEPTPTSTSTPAPSGPPISAAVGMVWTRPIDGMEMVFVPGGSFMMGSDPAVDTYALNNEQPQHEVTLDPFWIDRTEVTNAQFAAFLNEMGNQTEGGVSWLDAADSDARIDEIDGEFQAQTGFADHPVTEVSWYGAQAYCAWADGEAITVTLPTEAQWEYAARGPEGFIYPWGNEYDASLLNDSGTTAFAGTSPVGTFPDGGSWVGAVDMAGNVWEWTADWYDSDYYESAPAENPPGPETGSFRVLRGGGWVSNRPFVRAAFRGNVVPDDTLSAFGFRCVAPPG